MSIADTMMLLTQIRHAVGLLQSLSDPSTAGEHESLPGESVVQKSAHILDNILEGIDVYTRTQPQRVFSREEQAVLHLDEHDGDGAEHGRRGTR